MVQIFCIFVIVYLSEYQWISAGCIKPSAMKHYDLQLFPVYTDEKSYFILDALK